jgi:hypothetical protein
MNPILPRTVSFNSFPISSKKCGTGNGVRGGGFEPVRTKYKNVRRRLYPRYSTFEVNPPRLNFEVQYNSAWRKMYADDAPPVKNALHHLPRQPPPKKADIPVIILRTK